MSDKDKDKDKEQLQNELMELRKEITELEIIKGNQKQTEKKSTRSKEMYRLIAENTSDVITLHNFNLQATFAYISPSIKDVSGYEPEELLGKSPFEFIHPDDKKKLFPKLKNSINAKLKKLFIGKKLPTSMRIELHFKNKNGNWRYIQSTGNLLGDQLLFITRDITDQKKVEEALRIRQQEFASLFKSNPEALVYLDEKGIILDANIRFCKLFGYSLKEIIGRNIDDGMIHALDKIEEDKKLSMRGLKGYLNYESIRKKKDGTLFPVSISATPLVIDSQAKGVIGTYIDITERKRNEQLNKVLYNISKAANSLISLNQLYKTIHKELGTIINATNFYIALLDKKEDKLYFPYHVDEKEDDFTPQKLKNGKSLTCYVIENAYSSLLNYNTMKELIDHKKLINPGVVTEKISWLGVPLMIEDRVVGAMAVQSYTNPELYTERDIKLLEFVSSQVATAIERKSSEEKIKYLSFHDSLSGLYNRAYFEEELERYNFPRCYPLSIVMLDINGLKVINDTFGHSEGDRLLQHFSQILSFVSRQGDVLARIGGDEFAILLPFTTSEQAQEFCERIKKACQQDKIKPTYLRPNISLGHTTQQGEYKDTNTLLIEADKKMYQDKLSNSKSREKHFLEAFSVILAKRDTHTHLHAHRLQKLAFSLGERVGLTKYQLGNLKLLALLHDVGKIGTPDTILFKTCILTPSEWEKMREHSRMGYRIAKNIPYFAPIAQEILYHHEHWDGNGYPDGLKGEEIPLLSRIVSIIDAYDVMQSPHPYKRAVSKTKALKEIKRCAGTQFDPLLVEIFLKIVKK